MPVPPPLNPEFLSTAPTTTTSSTDLLLDPEEPNVARLQHIPPRNRSPHPYLYHNDALRVLHSPTPPPHPPSSASNNPIPPPTNDVSLPPHSLLPNSSHAPSSTPSISVSPSVAAIMPSSSSSDADDESPAASSAAVGVRALPPPLLRPRKGLRGAGLEDAGPGLEELDALMRPREGRVFWGGKGKATGRGRMDGEGEGLEEKRRWVEFRRRRRAEMVRRIGETGVLAVVGGVVLVGKGVWERAIGWHRELGAHMAIFTMLCALYPLRLIKYSLERALEERGPRRYGIRVPSAFDPATLLYPAFLPVLVALSLSPTDEQLILPNIVLGLSALPTRLILKFGTHTGYDCLHWVLSMIPLFASQWTAWPDKLSPLQPYRLKAPPPKGLDPETIICLYPLQTALTHPLRFLTTTSLLPAELQLLATALINLWLFAKSPQAKILSSLLLPAGLSLFVLVRHVLQWNVALARIPKWWLRRPGRVVIPQDSFLDFLTARLGAKGFTTSFLTPSEKDNESDADEDGHLLDKVKSKDPKPRLRALTTQLTNSTNYDDGTRSAVDHPSKNPIPGDANGTTHNITQIRPRKRRYTLSNVSELQSSPTSNLPSSARKTTRRHRSNSLAQSYLSLTPAQARTRRWLYAGYTYAVIALIILIPLRAYIGKQALNNHEPFGWALGYLFGDISALRTFTLSRCSLSTWIPLPSLPAFPPSSAQLARHAFTTPLSILRTDLGAPTTRLFMTTHWLLTLTVGITTVLVVPRFQPIEVDTRRKIFHGTIVALLLPTVPLDPAFAALTLALVLAVFLLLDTLRAAQIPPIAAPLARFLTPYVDGRDLRGPVVVSHMFLLVGCAIPLWMSLAGREREGGAAWEGWEVKGRDVGMVAGVVCVGMGDAAASLVGRRFGRRKWPWTGGKSLEGSAAFAAAVTVGLVFSKAWLRFGGWEEDVMWEGWSVVVGKAVAAACGSSFMEAVLTGGNDNVIVPVVLWLLVRGLQL